MPTRIAVVMTCFNPAGGERDKYAIETARSLVRYLSMYAEHSFRLVIADDGSDDTAYFNTIQFEVEQQWDSVDVSHVDRRGIGGSLNAALSKIDDDELWVYTTDDWLLEATVDLGPAVRLLTTGGYDYVRLLPVHPDLCCKTRFHEDIGWWLHIYQEQGGFAFATRPFIATKQFYYKVGPFPEKLDAYDTERIYADKVKSNVYLNLACVVDMHGPWRHIGTFEVGTIKP